MNIIPEEIIRAFVVEEPREVIIRLIREENENRILMNQEDILVLPDGDNGDDVNIYQNNMWNVAEIAGILRQAGVRDRIAGRALPLAGLLLRLRQVMEENAIVGAFEPHPFGRNKKEYWLPILREMVLGVIITILTIIVVQWLYIWSEHFHHVFNCVQTSEFYSLKCFVIKKSRSYLEEMNYNMVYTTVCGLGIAAANTLRKYQSAVDRQWS
jgi:hypothetical protein